MTRHTRADRDLAALLADASPDVAQANAAALTALRAEVAADIANAHVAAMLRTTDGAQEAAAALMQAGALGGAQVEPPAEDDNPLAAKCEQLWRIWNGPELAKEYRFHTARRWRFDYYHEPTRTAIELEGGLYSAGRHTRAAGYLGDIDKYNAAAMQGITVLRLGTGQVDAAHVAEIAAYVWRRMGEEG